MYFTDDKHQTKYHNCHQNSNLLSKNYSIFLVDYFRFPYHSLVLQVHWRFVYFGSPPHGNISILFCCGKTVLHCLCEQIQYRSLTKEKTTKLWSPVTMIFSPLQ